jgi:hypothetical protein
VIRALLLFLSVAAAYFFVMWPLSGYPGQALMTGLLAAVAFVIPFLIISSLITDRPWLAFLLTTTALVATFNGLELYGMLTLKNGHATRFGGRLLAIDGHITPAGFASMALDLAICVIGNCLEFLLYRILIRRLNIFQLSRSRSSARPSVP